MTTIAPHARLTPTQARFWIRHRGGQAERAGGRWNVAWQNQTINVDDAALCAMAERDRVGLLPATSATAPAGAVALVACVGEKLAQPAPARDLYQSPWFRKARAYAEQHAGRYFILSAHYGLIAPDEVRAPYDVTLTTMRAPERLAWAERVWPQLLAAVPDPRRERIVVLAGQHYRRHLHEWLRVAGYDVEVPMQGLGIGEQLAWLDRVMRPA